jgi:hypothetical protein
VSHLSVDRKHFAERDSQRRDSILFISNEHVEKFYFPCCVCILDFINGQFECTIFKKSVPCKTFEAKTRVLFGFFFPPNTLLEKFLPYWRCYRQE